MKKLPKQNLLLIMILKMKNKKIKKYLLIWYLITDNHFYYWFIQSFLYAINHARSKRGEGASDVIILQAHKKYSRIWE